MKKIITLIISILLSIGLFGCAPQSKSTEKSVDKDKKERIVAGSVAIAEILNKLDVEMVGMPSTERSIPDSMKNIPKVGMPMSPDLEKIRSLKPDIYMTSGALEEMIGDKLKSSGINTEYCDLSSYKSVKDTIKKISDKFCKQKESEKILSNFEEKEKKILNDISKKKKKKVMILFGAPGNFMLATEKSFVGSLIEQLGMENISSKINSKLKGPYIPLSLEVALKENPDVIFRMYHGYVEEAKKQVDLEFKNNNQWQKFEAIKNNKVYDLDTEYFGVTGTIKAVESLEKMKEYLYN